MNKPKTILALLVTAIFGFPIAGHASTTLDVQGGRLLGAFNVPVNGMYFDVRFEDLSCIDEFGGCDEASDFAFGTLAGATAAAQALLDHVFLDGGLGNFDTDPTLTYGCGFAEFCLSGVPYEIDGANVKVAFADNRAIEASDTVGSTTFPRALSLGNDTNIFFTANWAVFTKVQVPEPATLTLFGLGLAGLGFARRRKAA